MYNITPRTTVNLVITICFVIGLSISSIESVLARNHGHRAARNQSRNINRNHNVNRNFNRNTNANVNRNINRNVNINNNVNVNRNVNINNRTYAHPKYYGGRPYYYDNHHHGVSTGAAVAIGVAGLAVGTMIGASQLPPSCSTIIVNGISYQQCGSTWYQPQYSGSQVTYIVVNPPR